MTREIIMLVLLGLLAQSAGASFIGPDEIMPVPGQITGAGNGTLDLRMLTFSGSEITNAAGSFNGDNGNNGLPNSGGADTSSFGESYVTTAGDLKGFYDLNFTPGSINEIVLFLDLNEIGGGELNNTLVKLDIVLNPTSIQGDPDPLGDVSSAEQVAIGQIYTDGTLIASLNPEPADNIPVNNQGAGFADYAIFTGINPFSYDDSDVLLFSVSMDLGSNGSEEIFVSGTFSGIDVPEPATLVLVAAGAIGLLRRKRR